jgi:hypothetical protein
MIVSWFVRRSSVAWALGSFSCSPTKPRSPRSNAERADPIERAERARWAAGAHSAGYREFKRGDGYVNDLLGVVKVRI